MDSCTQPEWNTSEWQATAPEFLKNFKAKIIAAGTECAEAKSSNELTSEAVLMLSLIIIFVIFAVLGSLFTVFEQLWKENASSTNSKTDSDDKDSINNSQQVGRRKISKQQDWLSNSRSFFQCFCFVKNGRQLFRTEHDKEQFKCFNGVRVISNICIVTLHAGFYYMFTRRNLDKAKPLQQYKISTYFFHLIGAVDAFLVLSGFLNAYNFSKEFHKNKGRICWWHFYIKRFFRLTPAYMSVLGIYTVLLYYTGSGPIWPEYKTNPVCKTNWWLNLLYINNFESSYKTCMIWVWQLAADMQFYVISPIFLQLILRRRRTGYFITIIAIFFASLSSFVVSKQYNFLEFFSNLDVDKLDIFMDRLLNFIDKLYQVPYTRINSYLVGMLLGSYLYGKDFKTIKNSWKTFICGWIIVGIMLWIVGAPQSSREESVLETAIHYSRMHLFLSIGISWIIYICLTEQGGFLNSFLSWKMFYPLAKLSYCIFLIHLVIIHRGFQASTDLEEFSFSTWGLYTFSVYLQSVILAIPITLLFEMPMINLLDFIIRKNKLRVCTLKSNKSM